MARTRSRKDRKALHRGPTAPKRCSIMVPAQVGPATIPTRCEGRHFKAGRCAEHYRDWQHAKEARAIEAREYRAKQLMAGKVTKRGRVVLRSRPGAVKTTAWVPKSDRKRSKAA